MTLEFMNVGILKDLSQEDLKMMFEDFMISRFTLQRNVDDTVKAGCIIKEKCGLMTREVYFEDIVFSDNKLSQKIETNTFIDFVWKSKIKSLNKEYEIHPNVRFVYIEGIKAIYNQLTMDTISVRCEIPVVGTIFKRRMMKDDVGKRALANLETYRVSESEMRINDMIFLAYNNIFDKNSQKKITHLTFDSVLIDWRRLC